MEGMQAHKVEIRRPAKKKEKKKPAATRKRQDEHAVEGEPFIGECQQINAV